MDNLKILVIDDQKTILDYLKERLENEGSEVVTIDGGYKALDYISKKYFDVVITDLMLPGNVDGIHILEAVKEKNNETAVIIMTGYGTIDSAKNAIKKGATEYLCKPLDFSQLLICLNKVSNAKKQRTHSKPE